MTGGARPTTVQPCGSLGPCAGEWPGAGAAEQRWGSGMQRLQTQKARGLCDRDVCRARGQGPWGSPPWRGCADRLTGPGPREGPRHARVSTVSVHSARRGAKARKAAAAAGGNRAHSHRCWVALPPHPSAARVLSQRPRGPGVDGARGVGFCGVGKPPGKARRTRPRSRAGAARAQALAQEAPAVCRPRRSPLATTPTVATWLNASPRNTPTRPSERGALGTGVFEGS